MNQRKWTVLSVLAVGLLLLSACKQEFPMRRQSVPINRGLASGNPCKPPCWEGLVPGTSTEEEVQKTLARLQAEGQIVEFLCNAEGCRVTGAPGVSAGDVSIDLQDGMLIAVWGAVEFDFTAEQLVDLMGEPAMVFQWTAAYTPVGAIPSCDERGGQRDIVTHLFYPEHGAWFQVLVDGGDLGCVTRNAPVTSFQYFTPMSTSEAFQYLRREIVSLSYVDESDLVPWHGFGWGYGGK